MKDAQNSLNSYLNTLRGAAAKEPVNPQNTWERTMEEYEKCILHGDISGASILKALILNRLKQEPI